MALPSVYTQVYGQIPGFFQKIREAQIPLNFTQQYLKELGFGSSTHKTFIPILKTLGFLSSRGAPTSRYSLYKEKSQAQSVIADAVAEAYSDLFVLNAHPALSDKKLIEGLFKTTHNTTDRPAELMTKTFFSLLAVAGVAAAASNNHLVSVSESAPEQRFSVPKNMNIAAPQHQQPILNAGLHHSIQIHLPVTKDIEVYHLIFKSLRQHLFV